jgi:CubicO group peptidase (beta-lactamase class C family)
MTGGAKVQFRVLYRQFLFRMVDLDVLSAHALGDVNKLLGQFAALLIFISVAMSFGAFGFADAKMTPDARLTLTVYMEHFLVATTMLVVGIFAVLSWDSTFPDRRDVLVLAPLPVRPRTMFLAKVAATATALSLVVLLLHAATGLIWPLAFAKQATPQVVPALTFDPTRTPVSAADLQPVLDKDLKQALTSGWLAPGGGSGLAIGVSKDGVRRVFAYAAARPDSLFEIGSISKTFTGLMLARMVEQGRARFDEPVRALLPPGTVAKPSGNEISLLDLATHHSGLPPIPDNFLISESNPCSDYGAADLYAYLAKRGVEKPRDVSFVYSNLGMGLLGQALAVRAGTSYSDLLREEVTRPLGLTDTVVSLSEEQNRRFMQGLDAKRNPVHPCNLDALAGAGGVRSSASDMLTYIEANLHPERFTSMAQSLVDSHRLRADAPGGMQIGLAWVYKPDIGEYWHNGATAGFTSHAFFNPKGDYGAVVLLNNGPNPLASSYLIAEHIRQRLSGEPAVSLDTVPMPASEGFLGAVRWFAAYWFTMLASGAFIYCGVLGVQGLAAQLLPRRLFLRISGFLQMAAFCLFVGMYFLQPAFFGLVPLMVPETRHWLLWSPSYWFLGLFHELNGSIHPALSSLARRAWTGLAIAGLAATVSYALSYMRTMRQIVEEPDITSGPRLFRWLPRFGNEMQTAIGQFSVRTLARSRQHRLILAFYLGIGLAFTIFLLQSLAMNPQLPDAPAGDQWHNVNTPLLAASIMMSTLAVVGARVVFAFPLELRANWIFRIVGVQGGREILAASRRALLLLSVAPVWLISAVVCLRLWPWYQAAGHLLGLGLLGTALVDLALRGFRKIPFTCSYLPGKSQVHMIFLGALGLGWLVAQSATFEQQALQEPRTIVAMLALLGVVATGVRWSMAFLARLDDRDLQFEEVPTPAVFELGLQRDGVITVGPPPDRPSNS